MEGINKGYIKELTTFAKNHKMICIGTLGLAFLAYAAGKLVGRVVSWFANCRGTAKKTKSVATSAFHAITTQQPTLRGTSSQKALQLTPSPENELKVKNSQLIEIILTTPPYTENPANNDIACGDYRGGEFPKEYMDVFTHKHQIFENVYLGDYRGFLSVDPSFLSSHSIFDSAADALGDLNQNERARNQYLKQIDQEGCSRLGVKYVLSATMFQPKASVPADDWSRFAPNLESLGIERLQISVDDDDFAWENIKPHLESTFEFIDRARSSGKPCLIHCVKGASRSVAILTAYLMNRLGVTKDQAFNFIKTKRTIAELKPTIGQGLDEYQRELAAQNSMV
jgi:hypothetical protein